jgi:hypothetical protein
MADLTDTGTAPCNKRTCPCCGVVLVKREGDAPSSYARRKYCSNHCARKRATWKNPVERFEARVDRSSGHGPRGTCHLWTGRQTKGGYGVITVDGSEVLAHRFAYERFNKRSPGELHVCHHCDNPPCVNGDHLFLGTHAGNMLDMALKGRANGQRGELHTSAKLTIEDVRAIRGDHRSNDMLAAIYGVTKVAIRYVRSGRTWKHVE